YGAQKSSSADIITPLTESTATDSRGVLLYPADEALKLVDEQPETADRLLTVGARLDLAGTFGDGERTYPARRPDKTVSHEPALLGARAANSLANRKSLAQEHGQHLPFEVTVTQCLACKMYQIDRPRA